MSAPRRFDKPARAIPNLIALMQARGLAITDMAECTHSLTYIGYYRLSGYMLPLQDAGEGPNRHAFRPGTDFKDVLDLYSFDRQLRLVAMDPLERIEVALRTAITDTLSVPYGPFWYSDRNRFRPHFHVRYLDDIRDEIGYSEPKHRYNLHTALSR